MGMCMSAEDKENKRKNDEIERQLKRDKRTWKKEVKLLLLGAGGSGKSTIVKQMRIIHGEGYSAKDLMEYQQLIFSQVVSNMQVIIDAMERLGIELGDSGLKAAHDSVRDTVAPKVSSLEGDIKTQIKALWEDAGVRQAFSRRREYQLNDSAEYYFSALDRIGGGNYTPTEQDVLRVRVPTTGIVEYKFDINKVIFRMVDVGGQRSERRKWIHCFEQVTSIIFIVALSEYDQVLLEDENQNRMRESMALFDNICNYKWFENTSIILFLNKLDLFERKIQVSDLREYFPQYPGENGNVDESKNFVLNMFGDLKRDENKPLYPHFTTATDTENIKFVFAAVRDTILQNNLKDYGLV